MPATTRQGTGGAPREPRKDVSRVARRGSTSARTRRARSCASPGGRSVEVPGRRAGRPRSRSSPRCRRSGRSAGGRAGCPRGRSPRRRSDGGAMSAGAHRRGRRHRPVLHSRHLDRASSSSASARSLARVSMDSSTSSEPSTSSITSWSMVPVDRIRSTSARSVVMVCQPQPAVLLRGVSRVAGVRAVSHSASGRAAIRSRTRWIDVRVVVRPADLVELGQRRVARGLQHRRGLQGVGAGIGPAETEPADQVRQGQALDQQRAGHHDHRAEDEHVPVGHVDRDQQGRGQRHHPAQPGPAEHERVRPRRRLARSRPRGTGTSWADDHPDHPDDDHPEQHRDAEARRSGRPAGRMLPTC